MEMKFLEAGNGTLTTGCAEMYKQVRRRLSMLRSNENLAAGTFAQRVRTLALIRTWSSAWLDPVA